jgi:hypothetical protein
MMDCTEYRKSILADPRHPSAAMTRHAATCHDCTAYTERLLRFESRLDEALRLDLKETGKGTVTPLRAGRSPEGRLRRPVLAIAASILFAAVLAGGLWLGAPGPSLAADVVNHMAEEPGAWTRTDVPVAQRTLDEVMNESNMRLKPNAGLVSYANSCLFRGHQVPHLVVQTAAGPVTVMVLTHESLASPVRFDEHGYRGMIVPVPAHGSLAVLERAPATDMQVMKAVAAQVQSAIEWTR